MYAGEEYSQVKTPIGLNMDTDMIRIKQICILNSIRKRVSNNDKSKGIFAGLWILPSKINHSCLCNSAREFFGNIMFVHAIKDLKKGEEITLSYADTQAPYKLRCQSLMFFQSFRCSCELCVLDSSDVNYEKRTEILDKEEQKIRLLTFSNPKQALKLTFDLINKLHKTFENRDKLKLQLLRAMEIVLILCQFLTEKEYEKFTQLCHEMMNISGLFSFFIIPGPLIRAAEFYRKSNKIGEAKAALDTIVKMYKIKSGLDRDLFKKKYFRELNSSNVYDLV
jgi:hypothetical protein